MAAEDFDFPRLSPIARTRQFVDYFFCLAYGMIGVEFALELAGAHNGSGFKSFLNWITYPMLGPFEGLFPDPVILNHFHLRVSYLVALIIYSLVHLAVYYFLRLLQPRRQLL